MGVENDMQILDADEIRYDYGDVIKSLKRLLEEEWRVEQVVSFSNNVMLYDGYPIGLNLSRKEPTPLDEKKDEPNKITPRPATTIYIPADENNIPPRRRYKVSGMDAEETGGAYMERCHNHQLEGVQSIAEALRHNGIMCEVISWDNKRGLPFLAIDLAQHNLPWKIQNCSGQLILVEQFAVPPSDERKVVRRWYHTNKYHIA